MELGNMIYGHSRGEYPIPREDRWHAPLTELLDTLKLDGYGCPGFADEQLQIRSYYWGDCTCGYEERWSAKDEVWCAENVHAPTCYQTELHARMAEYDRESGYAAINEEAFGEREKHVGPLLSGFVSTFEQSPEHPFLMSGTFLPRTDDAMEAWRKAHDKRGKFEEKLFRELGKKYGVDPQYGAAVHCTCDYEEKRAAWCDTDNHDMAACRIVLPNLAWKPTGLEIRWYKYPLRDSYMNQELSLKAWRSVFRAMREHAEAHS